MSVPFGQNDDENQRPESFELAEPSQSQLRTLSFDRQDELVEAFAVFDKESRGRVAVKDLPGFLQMLGFIVSEAQLQELLSSMFSSPRENIGLTDFLNLLERLWRTADEAKDLLATFDLFDADSDGFLTAGDLCQVMSRLGVRLTVEEAVEMVHMADADQDGKLSYAEFAWAVRHGDWS